MYFGLGAACSLFARCISVAPRFLGKVPGAVVCPCHLGSAFSIQQTVAISVGCFGVPGIPELLFKYFHIFEPLSKQTG